MKLNLSEIKYPPMNILCFSDDRKVMYGFAKYYNEFFEVNLQTHIISSLGKLNNEKDTMDLAFQMEYYHGKIIIIPRLGNYLCIYDCQTKKQFNFEIGDILGEKHYNFAGLFHCIYNGFLYLIHRNPVIISKLDLQSYEYTVIYDGICNSSTFLDLYNCTGKYAACFAMNKNELILFDAEKENIRRIILPEECAGFTRPFFDGKSIWLYHLKNNEVYQCNISGVLLSKKKLKHNLDEKGLHMIFRMIDSNLYLFPNKQGCYFNIAEKKITTCKYKTVDNKICWLSGDDGKDPYFVCLGWDEAGDVPRYSTSSVTTFVCRKLELETGIFQNIPIINLEKIENIHSKILQSYGNLLLKDMFYKENEKFSLKRFLEAISYKRN